MDLHIGLSQQQSMKLVMTQELSQAIALLQLSSIELVEFLEDKVLENPFLEIKSNINDLYKTPKKVNGTPSNEINWIEQISDQRFSLSDHLLPQIQDMNISPLQYKVVIHYIESLDENGYFTGNLSNIAHYYNISIEEAEKCLSILQKVEPAGVGARTLQECLLLQIERQNGKNELVNKILSEYFSTFAKKKWKPLAKLLAVDIKEIQHIYDYIQTLNPKPGSPFQYESVPYVIPDVLVFQKEGHFFVQYNDPFLSKISFNQEYYNSLSSIQDKKVASFLSEKKHDFEWIVRSIEQRKTTIITVTKKIVEKQLKFFKSGASFLKPMTMKEISDELGIHESTVSRAVREKYVQTPYGTIELKSFFTNAIESTYSEPISSNKVKQVLEKLIQEENKQKPLSDLNLVNLLQELEGITVSRRTITKYRKNLGILSSSKRKRYD